MLIIKQNANGMLMRILLVFLVQFAFCTFSLAEGLLQAPRGALISVRADTGVAVGPSLFAGRAKTGLFAPMPRRAEMVPAIEVHTGIDRLRQLISDAESRRDGYDAVQHGARIKPPKAPTQMTVAEIFAWIKATPGQPHAIGRYQFIPSTLRRVVRVAGVSTKARFTPEVQDRLADVLLADAGLEKMRAGTLSRRAFMNNLAKIWAGLPNDTGKSHYHGYAGNKASFSWAYFEAEMAKIFPS